MYLERIGGRTALMMAILLLVAAALSLFSGDECRDVIVEPYGKICVGGPND